jgi:2-polyprenyl-6-hydroxyphenyl methylase/3-demethylubiquinone-9 3-methyltransferase
MNPASPSIDAKEVERFSTLAEGWWDPKGSMAALHRINPARLGYLRQTLAAHFSRDARSLNPFHHLRILDIGCGGGLISEPLARLGAEVTGIDAAEANIAVARAHAREADLEIDYRQASAEELSATRERFDVVLALEIVEHVADFDAFLEGAAALVRPGGAFIASTLNRTPRSLLFAIVGAEYILGWLPRGTHRWDRFLRPSEFAAALRRHGLQGRDIRGLIYDPLTGEWRLGRDLGINYLVFAVRPTA